MFRISTRFSLSVNPEIRDMTRVLLISFHCVVLERVFPFLKKKWMKYFPCLGKTYLCACQVTYWNSKLCSLRKNDKFSVNSLTEFRNFPKRKSCNLVHEHHVTLFFCKFSKIRNCCTLAQLLLPSREEDLIQIQSFGPRWCGPFLSPNSRLLQERVLEARWRVIPVSIHETRR
jgi:hypothetical protein